MVLGYILLLQSITKGLAQKHGSRTHEGFSWIFQKTFLHHHLTSVRYNRFALTETAPELRQSLRLPIVTQKVTGSSCRVMEIK